MKSVALFFAAIALSLFGTPSICMEGPPQPYKLVQSSSPQLRASTSLRDMLAQRNPNKTPYLTKLNG